MTDEQKVELSAAVLDFLQKQAPAAYSVSNILKGLDLPMKQWGKVMDACQQAVKDGKLHVERERPRSFAWNGKTKRAKPKAESS